MYGVKIDSKSMTANKNEYRGFGRFSPWILEPNHSKSVGQKTIIINGVPEPAKNKKGVDRIIKHEAKSETLLLNHLLSSNINKNPNKSPTMILGSLIVKGDSPQKVIEYFCSIRYGKSTISPFKIPFLPR